MRSVLPKPVTKRKNTFDLDNLSEADIQKLRQVIGIESVPLLNFYHMSPMKTISRPLWGHFGSFGPQNAC